MPRFLLNLVCWLGAATPGFAADPSALLRGAAATEARQNSQAALDLFLQADELRPNDAWILQKIARQYSDLVGDQPDVAAKKHYAQTALDYSERAAALNPKDPVNVLSLAVCHGKLALYSDTADKVRYSRLVKDEAEQALALDPNYSWGHHVLGRWHYEVATLGAASKFLVRLIYGGLPPASFDEGVRHLRRAVELEPAELDHQLELGFACAAAGQPAQARNAWVRGLAMPSRGKHDDSAKARARQALDRLNQDQHDGRDH
jgi:tetratricopeptide (TPR) repeat protein